jgi:hypothetical protein
MVLAALTLALALGQTGAAGQQQAPQTDETVPVQRGARLSVNNFAGEVSIHTWEKDSVHVQARHQSRTRVNIKPSPGALSISASGTMGPPGSVDYDITAPAWMPVKVEGTYDYVMIDGAQSEVSAETMRGDIVIKGGTGSIRAKSVQGEVTVEGARGKVNVSCVNEGIKISDSGGEIVAETINGAVTMTGMSATSVDVSSVNGDVSYEGSIADNGRYAFTTHNGDVTLGVPETANATFTVRTYNGDFHTTLPLKGPPKEEMHRGKRVALTLGNGSADVELETFGGTIAVRRGTVGRPRGRD